MKLSALLFSVLISFYSCSKTIKGEVNGQLYYITPVDSSENVMIETKSFSGIIFNRNTKSYNLKQPDTFTPSPEEIFKAEKILKRCVEVDKITSDSLDIRPHAIYELVKYHRQYFGYYNKAEKKMVLIKCISGAGRPGSIFPKEYVKEEIVIQDGGEGYFYIHTNIDTGECTTFYRGS